MPSSSSPLIVAQNNRTPGTLTVSLATKPWNLISRVLPFCSSDIKSITAGCMKALSEFNVSKIGDAWDPPIICLGFSAGKFVETSSQQTQSLLRFTTKQKEADVLFGDCTRPCSSRDLEATTVSSAQTKRGLDKYFGAEKYKEKDCEDRQANFGSVGHGNKERSRGNAGKLRESLSPYSKITVQEKAGIIAEPDDGANEECIEACGQLQTMRNARPSSDSFVVKSSNNELRSHELSDFPTAELMDKSREVRPDNSRSASGSKSSYCAVSSTNTGFNPTGNNVAVSADDFMSCERCGKTIIVWDLPEHMDFHLAHDLSRKLNNPPPPSVTSSIGKPGLPAKRPRVETPNINSFFKPKK